MFSQSLEDYDSSQRIIATKCFRNNITKYDSSQEVLAPSEDIKQARYITLEEQKEFVEFLDAYDIRSDKLAWCASDCKSFHCSNNPNHSTKTNYMLCGERGLCPSCSMAYATSKANETYQSVKRNFADRVDFDLKMNQIVLTLPKELHEIDKKVFSKMIKQFLIKFGISCYGYVIQTRSSSNPLGNSYHHVHIISLNVKVENNRIVQSDYFFDTDDMRKEWKKIIEGNTDISIEGNVNLQTGYASVNREKGRCIHLLKYVYRFSLEDLFKVQVRNHSINYVQKSHFNEVKESIENLIDEKKPKFVWCGLMAPTKHKELMKMISEIGYEWQSLKQIKTDLMIKANTCRDCGCQFEEKPFHVFKYTGDNEPIKPVYPT